MEEAIIFHPIVPWLDETAYRTILMMLLDYIIVFGIVILGCSNQKLRPGKAQNLVEWAVKFITNYADEMIGPQAPTYYPLLIMLFFYILVGNLMGLIPGLVSPTSNVNVPLALALVVFVTEHFNGIRKKGIINYLKHFTGGTGVPGWLKPFMFFIEIIGELARPVSLTFRLFGNIVAKEILLGVLVMLVVLFWPDLSSHDMLKKAIAGSLGGFAFLMRHLIIVLGTLVSIIQASVFTLLTSIYISAAVQSHEDHPEEATGH